MAQHTSDESILAKITSLVHEEQRLYAQNNLSDHDQVRLEKMKVELFRRFTWPGKESCVGRP